MWFPESFRGAPALRFSEERAVVIRHFFKLLIRFPVVNCVLLGGKPDGFHAYQVKQLVMMVLSPTFFAALFAAKSKRWLAALGFINACFVAACAVCVPFAYKYAPDLRAAFWDTLGPQENLPRRFAQIAVALAASPYASRLAVLAFHLDAAPPSPPRALAAIRKLRVSSEIHAGPSGMTKKQKRKGDGEDRGTREKCERAAALGGAEFGVDDKNAARFCDAADVGELTVTELSASALCFRGPAPQCVTVRGVSPGVSLRVTFEGHVLRTTSEFIRDAESGAVHTLLRVWPPELETGAQIGKSASGDVDRPSPPPFGRAWVSSGYVRESVSLAKEKRASRELETTFETTGEATALLFLLDPETAREVNNAVMLIRHNMSSVLANRLVMRMGNCITRATFNLTENQVMTEVTATMGMVRCERMLTAFRARVAGEANAAELSQAGTFSRGAAAEGTRAFSSRGRRAARGARESPEESDSDDADVVDGPEEAAGGDAPRALSLIHI